MSKNKTVVGYGYRLSSESVEKALRHYIDNHSLKLHKTEGAVSSHIKFDKKMGFIGKSSKPKRFRIIVEEID